METINVRRKYEVGDKVTVFVVKNHVSAAAEQVLVAVMSRVFVMIVVRAVASISLRKRK